MRSSYKITAHLALALVLVLGAFVYGAAWGQSALAQADIVARKALESKQYPQVLKAYEGMVDQDLSDQAFYRMAISMQRLGDSLAAQNALDRALMKNPKGTFASSPERLALLKQDIAKGFAAQGAQATNLQLPSLPPPAAPVLQANQTVEVPKAASDTLAVIVVPPIQTPVNAASAPNAPVLGQPQSQTNQQINRESRDQNRRSSVKTWLAEWIPFLLWAVFALLVGTMIYKLLVRNKKLKVEPVSDVSELVALREQVSHMIALIEAAGTTDSKLYTALEKLAPLLFMEIGRNHYRNSRDPKVLTTEDQALLASVTHLEKTPMSLDGAEPQEVMRYLAGGRERFAKSLDL